MDLDLIKWLKSKVESKERVISLTLWVLIFVVAGVTSFLDEMHVMWHIWLASLGSFLLFKSYNRFLFPWISLALEWESKSKIHSTILVSSYIVGFASGPSLVTALINLICISSAIMLIHPILPIYCLPGLGVLLSMTLPILAFFNIFHYTAAIPAAVASMLLTVYLFRIAYENEVKSICKDIENDNNHLTTKSTILPSALSILSIIFTGTVIFYWICLSANPFWMRAKRISKYESLHRLPHDVNLRVREVNSLEDLEFYRPKITSFPVIIKPSICTTSSKNVVRCDNYKCLKTYVKARLAENKFGAWVIQEYAPDIEGVVFYYKLPYMSTGAIKNIGIRTESDKELTATKENKITANYWPTEYRHDATPQFTAFFDDLASKIPGYYGGRFDVMLKSKDLKDPRDVSVLEMNVFFLASIDEKIVKCFADQMRQFRTTLLQIYIGVVNIVAGYNYLSFFGIALKVPGLISRSVQCDNFEHVFAKP